MQDLNREAHAREVASRALERAQRGRAAGPAPGRVRRDQDHEAGARAHGRLGGRGCQRHRVDRALRMGHQGRADRARSRARSPSPSPSRSRSPESPSPSPGAELRTPPCASAAGCGRLFGWDGRDGASSPSGSPARSRGARAAPEPEPRARAASRSPSRSPSRARRRRTRTLDRDGAQAALEERPRGARLRAPPPVLARLALRYAPDPCSTRSGEPGHHTSPLPAATSAAAATGVAAGRPRRRSPSDPDGPNLILVIVDSLRADAVYDRAIPTPNIDELLASRGCASRAPTPRRCRPCRPATRSSAAGAPSRSATGTTTRACWTRRAGRRCATSTSRCRPCCAGPATGPAYVTDNPFLGFSRPYAPLRRSVELLRAHRRRDRRQPPGLERPGQGAAPLAAPRRSRPDKRERVGRYLANSRYWHDERRSFAAKVMKDAVRALEAGRPPPPVRAGRRHLRAARAVDPAAAVRRPVRRSGSGPEPAMPRYGQGRQLAARRASAARSCAGCASSTRPR